MKGISQQMCSDVTNVDSLTYKNARVSYGEKVLTVQTLK